MSTAQVANTGIVGASPRIPLPRNGIASSFEYVDSLGGAYASPPRDQWHRFDDDTEPFDTNPRRHGRHRGPFQEQVVSFGGVLVSREIGAAIMQVQAAYTANIPPPVAAEAERGVAVYEFNQALMGAAEVVTNIGYSAGIGYGAEAR
jgi:hypothetical protein